jgi:hypothetical protein
MPHYLNAILKNGVLVLILVQTSMSQAQEMLGITTSNFAGSNGAILNPATIVSSKLYMDINIITADAYFENNYLYIHSKDFKLLKYLGPNPKFPSYPPNGSAVDFYKTTNPKKAYVQALVKGPSFMIARGNHAFAFHTGVRVLTSVSNMAYDLANFGYNSLKYEPQQNILYNDNNAMTGTVAFGEVGVTYAYAFRRFNLDDWSAGVTVKYLLGYAGAYANVDNINYMIPNDTTADIRNLRADAGYSLPVNYSNNNYPFGGAIRGGGFGFDIGVSYQRKVLSYQKRRIKKLCRQKHTDYIYKIGASFIDLGSVKFTKNAVVHSFDNVSRNWLNIDTLSYYNMNTLSSTLSNVFYGDPNASYRSSQFSVFLPAAFSLQGDYNFYQDWYVGGVFIHPLQISKSMVHRPTQIALIPRFETQDLEVSIPISLYEWRYPRIGAAIRYQFITIGTDKLSGLLGLTDFTGLDFYVSIKINFRKGHCRYNSFVPCENDEYDIEK